MDEQSTRKSTHRLNIGCIQDHLATTIIGAHQRIVYHHTVPSTNSVAMQLARNGSEEGVVVIADNQTAGKGRQGRRWVDIAGCNVLSSTILRPLFPPYFLVMLASLAVVRAIAETCHGTATIKWPNDVLIERRKVAGILIETSHDHDGQLVAILGIGVNVNGYIAQLTSNVSESSQANSELADKAITLEEAFGHTVSREQFIAHLLQQVEIQYLALQQAMLTTHNFVTISRLLRDEWRSHLSTLGQSIQVRQGQSLLSGVAEDVNDQGELLLRTHSGECISITWGDIG